MKNFIGALLGGLPRALCLLTCMVIGPNDVLKSLPLADSARQGVRGQVLFLVSRHVCQPADRSVVQVQNICNFSLAVPITMYRPDNQRVSLGLG